jgi:hypothetical protein
VLRRSLLLVLALGGFVRALPAQGFVRPVLRVSSTPGDMPPDGYLEITATARLEALERKENQVGGGWRKPKLELLAVSIGINSGQAGQPPVEYPIALYDLKSKQEQTITAFQLGRAQYITLGPGAPTPSLTVSVRAVPRDLAKEFLSGVSAFNSVLTSGTGGLLPIPPQVTAATKLLTSFLDPFVQQHPEWSSSLPIGLTNGSLSVVPLNGDLAVIFLQSARNKSPLPIGTDLETCAGAPGQLCAKSSGREFSAVPYIMLSARVLPYRTLDVAPLAPLSCASTTADLATRNDAIRQSSLTPQQRALEERLSERFQLVLDVRNGALKTDDAIADLAFRWSLRNTRLGEQKYWQTHASAKAAVFDNCFLGAVTSAGIEASQRWKIFSSALETAVSWKSNKVEHNRIAQLEAYLYALTSPTRSLNVKAGPAYVMLRDEQQEIESELARSDVAAAQQVARTEDLPSLRNVRQQLDTRRKETMCERCRDVLTVAIGQADTRIASLERQPAATIANIADALPAKADLAEVQQEARQLIDVIRSLDADKSAPAQQLQQDLESATDVLSRRSSTAAEIQPRIDALRTAVQKARAIVAKP